MWHAQYPIALVLATLSTALILLERGQGVRVILALPWKGDLKRETRWFAQYGQASCTLVVAMVLACFDLKGRPIDPWLMVLISVFSASGIGMLIKRLVGRVRPNHERAGQFLGWTWKHQNWRESFPSTHTACAVALSYVLASWYPQGAIVFWGLAAMCGTLRYVMDAHWPSDVVAGAALGWVVGAACWRWLQ